MSTRRAKQLVYGALYAIFWIAVIAVAYFIFTWLSGGTPAVAQCGAECVPTSTQSIVVQGNINTFVTSPDHYTFLAQVANVNDNFGARNFDYDLNIYSDASDTLLESLPGQTFIYASQVKYLVFPNEVITGNIDHMTLSIVDATWAATSTMGSAPQFTFGNLTPSTASTTVSIGGAITNSGIASYGDITVVALFTDEYGNPIGVSQTEINAIGADQSTNFSVIYPAVQGVNPAQSLLFGYGIRQ